MIPERGPQTVFKEFLSGAIKNAKMQKCKIANIANMQNCNNTKVQNCKM